MYIMVTEVKKSMDDRFVTTALSVETRKRLEDFGRMTESYDQVIKRLLDTLEEQYR
jgi:hypothetical protein